MSLPSPVVLEKVSFAYGKLPILQDITFSCEQGQTIGLLGGSGSGKTTILNLISGLIEPNSGSVHVEGRPSWEAVGQKRVGYLLQRPTLFPWLSVLENVALPLVVRHGGMSWINPFRRISRSQNERAMLALRNAKVPGIEDRYPNELSGGMQTRVSLARTLVANPAILLLDEPFSALDDRLCGELYSDVQTLIGTGQTTAILVTHSIVEALILCDRIIVIGRYNTRLLDRASRKESRVRPTA